MQLLPVSGAEDPETQCEASHLHGAPLPFTSLWYYCRVGVASTYHLIMVSLPPVLSALTYYRRRYEGLATRYA